MYFTTDAVQYGLLHKSGTLEVNTVSNHKNFGEENSDEIYTLEDEQKIQNWKNCAYFP